MNTASSFDDLDLRKVALLVARRSAATLNHHDREDLVGDIIADAVAACARTGIPAVKLAFMGASRPRYFQRAALAVMRRWPEGDPTSVATDTSSAMDVDDLIARMPTHLATAFRLTAMEGHTVRETAEAMGASVGAVQNWIAAARIRLERAWRAAEAA